MEAPSTPTRPAPGLLFAIGVLAIVLVCGLQLTRSPNAASDRAARPPAAKTKPQVTQTQRPAGPAAAPDGRQEIARARAFARDWLDYLGGRREVSSVRGASDELRLAFAGGAPPALSISDSDLRSVTCTRETTQGRVCTATARVLGRFRFAMTPADGGQLEVSGVELD